MYVYVRKYIYKKIHKFGSINDIMVLIFEMAFPYSFNFNFHFLSLNWKWKMVKKYNVQQSDACVCKSHFHI